GGIVGADVDAAGPAHPLVRDGGVVQPAGAGGRVDPDACLASALPSSRQFRLVGLVCRVRGTSAGTATSERSAAGGGGQRRPCARLLAADRRAGAGVALSAAEPVRSLQRLALAGLGTAADRLSVGHCSVASSALAGGWFRAAIPADGSGAAGRTDAGLVLPAQRHHFRPQRLAARPAADPLARPGPAA